MKIAARTLIFMLLSTLALAACNPIKNIQSRERITELRAVVNTYRKLMRWGHYDQAAQYLKKKDGSQATSNFENMARYRVTSLTIADQITSDEELEAKVTAYIDFYDIDTGIASSLRDEQIWWYSVDDKRWFLGSPMVNFSDYVK